MTITNHLGLPQAFVDACQTEQHCKPGEYSITTLLNGTKQILLTARHWDEMEEDAADSFYKILGSAIHLILQRANKDAFAEEEVSFDFEGVRIVGHIDLYDLLAGKVIDYKSASVWKVILKDYADWYKQGAGYAWLLHKMKLPCKSVQFIAGLKDHSKSDAMKKADYPRSPVVIYEFGISEMDIYTFERFAREKIRDIKLAEKLIDDDIPPCSADERWEKPTVYAVMKEGRKSAVKLLDKKEDAELMIDNLPKGHYLETRIGVSTRCLHYCSVCKFCNFYKENVMNNKEADE